MALASQHRFYGFVARNFQRFFWPVLAGTLVVMLLQLQDQTVLRTDAAPSGIVSLEVGNYAKDTTIIASWKDTIPYIPADNFCEVSKVLPTRLQVAKSDVWWDYVFILFYTALLVIILATLQAEQEKDGRRTGTTGLGHLLVFFALAAGVCDCIENVGLLRFIGGDGDAGTAGLTRAVAVIKMVLLAGLGLYILFVLIFKHYGLQWISGYVRVKALQLFRFRLILLGVVFFSAPIWVMDQGQDLLVNVNADDWGVLLFIAVVVIAAFLNWYLAKLFFESQYVPPFWPLNEPVLTEPIPPAVFAQVLASEKKVSRYLGIATILIPGVAILNALSAVRLHYVLDTLSPMAWLAGLLIIFFVLIKHNVAENLYAVLAKKWGSTKWVTVGFLLVLVAGLPAIFRGVFIRHNRESPESLNYLFLDLVLIAFAFYIFVSVRGLAFKKTGVLGDRIGRLVLPAAVLMALGFIINNIFPFAAMRVDGCYLSLPVLLSGIVFYVLAITLVLRAGLFKKINFLFFIALGWFLIVVNGSNNFHAVRRMPVKTPPVSARLQDYFKQWVLQRQDEIREAPGTYPVFLVNSYGGGIRAAAFTNFVLSYMDDSLIRRSGAAGKPLRSFEHYVLSLSGASGGTVGSAIQCAFRATHPDSMPGAYANYQQGFENLYRHDFLTPTLAGILGRDVWSSGVADGWTALNGTLWPDRAAIQEELWARYGRKELGLNLDSEFNSIWDPARSGKLAYDVPLLFSNTLNVDDGLKGICAPVTLDFADFPEDIQIRDRINSLNANHRKNEDSLQSISLVTGAFLSARFPYISPSGKMGPGYHFMDGGGKDNSGAGTSAGIFFALSRYIGAERARSTDSVYSSLLSKLRFYFVSISNSATTTLHLPPSDDRMVVRNPFEPLNPIVGIINGGVTGNAMQADSALRSRFTGNPVFAGLYGGYFSVWPNTFCINPGTDSSYCPLAPLGWQISVPSLKRLEASFTIDKLGENPEGVLKILNVIRP